MTFITSRRIDATRYADLVACPRRLRWSRLQGWTPREKPETLWWGGLVDDSIRNYELSRFAGESKDTALDKALSYCLEHSRDPLDEAAAFPSSDNKRTGWTAARTLVQYADWTEELKISPIAMEGPRLGEIIPALEVYFEFLDKPSGWTICGNLDAIVSYGGQNWILERKTTTSSISPMYLSRFDMRSQVDFYTLAATRCPELVPYKIRGILLEVIQTGVQFSRFARYPIRRTEFQQDEALSNVRYQLTSILPRHEIEWAGGEDPYNPESCILCKFSTICKRDPRVRSKYLSADFDQREPWDPKTKRTLS